MIICRPGSGLILKSVWRNGVATRIVIVTRIHIMKGNVSSNEILFAEV